MLVGTTLPTVLPLFGLLVAGFLTDAFPQRDAYESVEYGFSLLASLSAAGGFAFLVVRISQGSGFLPFRRPVILAGESLTVAPTGHGEDWPVLIMLLFRPFFVLFAGLGGWVEAHGRSLGLWSAAGPPAI